MTSPLRADRFLYYNYEVKFKNGEWKPYIFREDIKKEHGIKLNSISNLCNDYEREGKTNPRRYKVADYTIRRVKISRGCIITENVKKFVPKDKNKEPVIIEKNKLKL